MVGSGRGRRRWLAVAILVVVGLWLAGLTGVAFAFGFVGGGESFNILHWEATRLVTFAAERSAAVVVRRTATNDEIARYFDLLSRARAARLRGVGAQDGGQAAAAFSEEQRLRTQADGLRVRVEARYEQAVDEAARREGLVEDLPLFGSVGLVWPPPATGFSVPPHILIISPRSRIALEDTQLLRSDLTEDRAERIEQEAERRPNTSALVDQIGGLGAYPSIADEDQSPLGLMQTVAHEWAHGYLAFHPLGARYAASNDMTLINETVADLVGRELGTQAFELPQLPPSPPKPASTQPAVDFNRTMHALRLEVDQLLKDGKVTEAELRMDETQKLLAANGYSIRRINQAYFAFYGSYGDSPASSNPLGSRVQILRRLSPSLAAFVREVQTVATPSDLDRLLRKASAAPAP